MEIEELESTDNGGEGYAGLQESYSSGAEGLRQAIGFAMEDESDEGEWSSTALDSSEGDSDDWERDEEGSNDGKWWSADETHEEEDVKKEVSQ